MGAKFDEKIKVADRKKIAFMFSSQMCAPGLKKYKEYDNVKAVWDKATAEMEKLNTGKYKFGKVFSSVFENCSLKIIFSRIIWVYQHGCFLPKNKENQTHFSKTI